MLFDRIPNCTFLRIRTKSLKIKSKNHLVKVSILFTLFTNFSLTNSLKLITLAGAGITIMGVLFHLQGQSIVGPESSFMYSNPLWVTYGIQIALFGAIIMAVGISLRFFKKSNQ